MMMGDTGAGKSWLIRQILMQVEGRGETAIVYDPALEYTPQFYEPGRGDVILNPVDARMPYWSPCDEVQHEAEAEGLAAALFKDDPRTNPFFVMVPRQIFAHLLIEQPKRTPEELLAILRDERELAKRLKDTEHAARASFTNSTSSWTSTGTLLCPVLVATTTTGSHTKTASCHRQVTPKSRGWRRWSRWRKAAPILAGTTILERIPKNTRLRVSRKKTPP
jgi:hypothetical protein